MAQYGLDDCRDVLRKGALLVHSPENLQVAEYLSHDEIETLENEATGGQCFPTNKSHGDSTTVMSCYIGGMVLYVAVII